MTTSKQRLTVYLTSAAELDDQREARAISAVNDAAEALRGVDPAMVPDLVVSLLRALDLDETALDALRRQVDDRLAWGFWPGEPGEKDA